jgi:hypothetical protein
VGFRPSRRQVLAGAGASALAVSGNALPSQRTAAPAVARGVVYADERGEGPRRPGDRGIRGVMVSNGRDVTLTGRDGEWALPVAPGESVFVIKPPHWATRASPTGLPRHAYLYQPAGSPAHLGAHAHKATPAGGLPDSIDFPLQRRPEPSEFEALLVTDTQPEGPAELDYLRDDILAAILGRNEPAFAINHGDVVADDLTLYPRYLGLIGATGLTWHHCPGNHDTDYAADDDRHSRETWKATFGPRWYAFQYAEATFFVLDNVEYLGSGRYRGVLGARQLQFIRNMLARIPPGGLVVLSMHIPLTCYLDPANPADTTADAAALLHALAGHPHTVSFAGHLHATEHHYLERGPALPAVSAMHPAEPAAFSVSAPSSASPALGAHHHHVLTAACGSWWSGHRDGRGIPSADSSDGTPNGFHILSVSGNRYTTRFVPAAGKPPAQLRLLIDGPHRTAAARGAAPQERPGLDRLGLHVPADALGACRILVNVFDGGPRTEVSLEVLVQGRRTEPVAMVPVSAPDPLTADMFSGSTPRKSWVTATPCAHLWQASLPAGLASGPHVLQVRVRDEYGREHQARAVMEVGA